MSIALMTEIAQNINTLRNPPPDTDLVDLIRRTQALFDGIFNADKHPDFDEAIPLYFSFMKLRLEKGLIILDDYKSQVEAAIELISGKVNFSEDTENLVEYLQQKKTALMHQT
jgi:hypothetical protein